MVCVYRFFLSRVSPVESSLYRNLCDRVSHIRLGSRVMKLPPSLCSFPRRPHGPCAYLRHKRYAVSFAKVIDRSAVAIDALKFLCESGEQHNRIAHIEIDVMACLFAPLACKNASVPLSGFGTTGAVM